MKKLWRAILVLSLLGSFSASAQAPKFKKGILVDEFIFEKTSFPESHAATIAETPKGLIAAWFGGTKERNPDVGIWVSRQVNNKWTAPVRLLEPRAVPGTRRRIAIILQSWSKRSRLDRLGKILKRQWFNLVESQSFARWLFGSGKK